MHFWHVHTLEAHRASSQHVWSLQIALRELKYPHKVHKISMKDNEQKQDWFLKINPNGRIPAIVDHDNNDYAVFESGAILMYLAEKAGKLYPQEFNKRHEVNQWLLFQNAGVGPMQGQANHFARCAYHGFTWCCIFFSHSASLAVCVGGFGHALCADAMATHTELFHVINVVAHIIHVGAPCVGMVNVKH